MIKPLASPFLAVVVNLASEALRVVKRLGKVLRLVMNCSAALLSPTKTKRCVRMTKNAYFSLLGHDNFFFRDNLLFTCRNC